VFSRGSYEGSFRGELEKFAKIAERESQKRALEHAALPLFESGQPDLASRVDEELAGFGPDP
jgi:hypothetical protein